MCVIDYEPCEVWRETPRKARKEHRCSACGGRIAAREGYTDYFSVFEGEINRGKACATCQTVVMEFAAAHEGMRPTPDSLVFILEECIADGDKEDKRRWTPVLAEMQTRRKAGR